MLSFALLFVLTSLASGSNAPWYPLLVPIHTGGHRHRHTTHIVTHPVVHTRVLMLGDDKQHHHHHHGHDHNHKHKARDYHQGQQTTYGRYSERDPTNAITPQRTSTQARHQAVSGNNHGSHSYSDFHHSQPEIKYSVLVSESPWKPLIRHPNEVPKEYLPLKYLGIDEAKVAKVVKEAMNEIERDMEAQHTRPRYPTGIQDLIGPPMKPLPPMYRGAVFYDDVPPGRYHVRTRPDHVGNYHMNKYLSRKNGVNLDLECQCQSPY